MEYAMDREADDLEKRELAGTKERQWVGGQDTEGMKVVDPLWWRSLNDDVMDDS